MGHWVLKSEYNRLSKEESETYNKAVNSKKEIEDLENKITSIKKKIETDIQDNHKKTVESGDCYVKGNEKIASLNKEIEALIDNHNKLYNQKVDLINSKINAIKSEQIRIDSKIKQLSDKINREFERITNSLNSQKDRANLYAEKLYKSISVISQLNPTKLLPNEYDNLNKKLNIVKSDIKNGDYGAAISVSQNSIFFAQEIEEKLRNLNNEFIRLDNIINTYLQKDEEFIKKCINDKSLDISYWSYNYFDEIIDSFNKDKQLFKKYLDDMDIQNLQDLEARAVEYIYKLFDCKNFALNEFDSYMKIVELSKSINELLEINTNWNLQDSGFIDKDARKPYYIDYSNDYYDTCCFTVNPVNKDGNKNSNLILNYNVTSPDVYRIEIVNKLIFSILEENEMTQYMDEDNPIFKQSFESNEDFLNACGIDCDKNNQKALNTVRNKEIIVMEGKNE